MNPGDAANDKIAPALAGLDPLFVFGLAALYGCARSVTRKFDTLDLGCGGAGVLAGIAGQSKGLLVGIDPSAENCAAARARLARFGARAQIVHKDFAAISPRNLGAFDLLLSLGFLHAVEPAAQRNLLDAIAFSLTPGGVAVIGFHASAAFGVSHVEAALAPRGVEYLNDLPAGDFGAHATSQERAYAADAFEADSGRFRICLFGKIGDAASEPDARASQVRWSTRLVHPAVGALYRADATYHDPVSRVSAHVTRMETQAALDELHGGVKTFAQLLSGARARLNRAGVKPGVDIAETISAALLHLTWARLATPLWKEP